jgi:hypothetical protein
MKGNFIDDRQRVGVFELFIYFIRNHVMLNLI